MNHFLKDKTGVSAETEAQNRSAIQRVEHKYHIVFPEALREYYSKYDGMQIDLCMIHKGERKYEVSRIIPLSGEGLTFEKIVDNDREDGLVDADFYPLASNRGGDLYYWCIEDQNVYLLYGDDIEHPIPICQGVSTFFESLQ